MTVLINDVPENVRRFNQDEAIWRCYEEKRERRKAWLRLFSLLKVQPPLSEEEMDRLDWLAAERDMHNSDCVGLRPRQNGRT